jgi:DNA modification methylase
MSKSKKKSEYVNQVLCGDWIKVLKEIPDDTFHCCVTSPPYWGQRLYWWGTKKPCDGKKINHDWKIGKTLRVCRNCGAKAPILGLEKTPEEHIENLVRGFREVRRVLRPDGVLWLNYGDKYIGDGCGYGYGTKSDTNKGCSGSVTGEGYDLGERNLLMLPARIALALQVDGWVLRDDVIWAKAISFCGKYSGSTMPESMNGTRWEKHRIKIGRRKAHFRGGVYQNQNGNQDNSQYRSEPEVNKYVDCPGCPKCEPNGGYILRKGSWRCTKAYEHLFQFVKSIDYFCDKEAVKEKSFDPESYEGRKFRSKTAIYDAGAYPGAQGNSIQNSQEHDYEGRTWAKRNLRNVWTINPRGYKDAHYATFPQALVKPCIKVSTSKEGVCPKCGAQWARMIKKKSSTMNIRVRDVKNEHFKHTDRVASESEVNNYGDESEEEVKTIGWRPTCGCGKKETERPLVLDPFMGSGTTAIVAINLRCNYTGIEINPEYVNEHANRRIRERKTGISISLQRTGFKGLLDQ